LLNRSAGQNSYRFFKILSDFPQTAFRDEANNRSGRIVAYLFAAAYTALRCSKKRRLPKQALRPEFQAKCSEKQLPAYRAAFRAEKINSDAPALSRATITRSHHPFQCINSHLVRYLG
jgi:hypothetical protein